MEIIEDRLNIGYDPVEMQEYKRITATFEFCEALDEVRLRHLNDVIVDEETGSECLRLWWPEDEGGESLQAYIEWRGNAGEAMQSKQQSIRSVVIESLEKGEIVESLRLELMTDGQVTLFVEDVHSGPVPAELKDIADLRTVLDEEGVYSQAA